MPRCLWCGSDAASVKYHDEEWGKLVTDEIKLFEFLILEGAQAGLSWLTILRRRENYQQAFALFDPKKVAAFDEEMVVQLLQNEGIIRNRLKVKSAIKNAKLFIDIQLEFGSFFAYILSYFPNQQPIVNYPTTMSEVPAFSAISDIISKDMKKRGFTFFGSTICYSFLQATGFINDHLVDCETKFEKQ